MAVVSTRSSTQRKRLTVSELQALWRARRRIYFDWTIRDIIYRVASRAMLEGVYSCVEVLKKKIEEDLNHLEHTIKVAALCKQHGWTVFYLEPALNPVGDLLIMRSTWVAVIEIKTHAPPWKGLNPAEAEMYYERELDLAKQGIRILYTWYDNRTMQYMCCTVEDLRYDKEQVTVTRSIQLTQWLKSPT